MQKLTDTFIKSLKPKSQRYVVREDAPRGEGGFCIRVMPSGSKSWQMIYSHEGTRKWLFLGEYPGMGLSTARSEFRKMRQILASGQDPGETTREKNRERRDAWTINKLCDEFLEKYAAVKKRPRSAHEDKLNLARDVRPAWGKRKARDVRRSDVVTLLDEIIARKAGVQANRTLATVRKMFAWGLEREVVEFNPATGISKPSVETPKDRTLSLSEIGTIWHNLDSTEDVPDGVKKALKLILLTGCRPDEVLSFHWDWADGNWIDISSLSTSNKRRQNTYLSSLARQITGKKGEGLIVSKSEGVKIPEYSLSYWVRSREYFGVAKWTPHDLRRTCSTMLAKAGTPPHIVSRVLNHAQTGITGKVYDQYTYGAEIAKALEKWGGTVEKIVSGAHERGKVVNLPL